MNHELFCPVCGWQSSLLDVVDFNKCCEEYRGTVLPLSGMPIYYAMCGACRFTFAPEMMKWSIDQFRERVYNDDYVRVDPDYVRVRPEANVRTLAKLFGERPEFVHLDYGGGNGRLSAVLRELGWRSNSYDPMVDREVDTASLGPVDLITAFEVFEHVPDVHKLMRDLRQLAGANSVLLFSTLLSDGEIQPRQRLNWWYAAPRNGHISLFTRQSLELLARQYGFQFASFSNGFHAFFASLPEWARHLNRS